MLSRIFKLFLNPIFIRKIVAYSLFIAFVYIFQDFLGMFFLIFIFSYLFLTLGEFLKANFDYLVNQICTHQKRKKIIKKIFSLNIIIIFLYLIFISIIFFTLYDLIPQIIKELKEIPKHIPIVANQVQEVTQKLEEIKNFNYKVSGDINKLFTQSNYDVVIKVLANLKTAGAMFIQVLLSLLLSYIFIMDRDKLAKYLEQIKKSNFSFLYEEYKIIISKITKSFGLIFKAQAMIATINATLTRLGLYIIGFIHPEDFPYILTLSVIVFICGFIPVLGTFISSIPLIIIRYTMVGGVNAVIQIVLLVAIIHAIEAYYLNPKIVSSFMEVPMSLTFLILILSEHFMGIAGLIVGISSFYLIVEILKDADQVIAKTKNMFDTQNNIISDSKMEIQSQIRVSRNIKENK